MAVASSLHRLHVVLAGGDRRFLRVAAFLLARRGHRVTTTTTAKEACDVVNLHGADAVVVDGGPSPRSALDAVEEIETLYPSVDVFLVHEDGETEVPPRPHVLPKWASAGVLARALEADETSTGAGVVPERRRKSWRTRGTA
jgi:NAD(P)-dependent dehydrogenase (short-subunit alcohol dehydrogenase family)